MVIQQLRKKTQIVMSAPSRILVEKYLSPKGQFLLLSAVTKKDKAEIWKKYGKNRYSKNPNAVPVKKITHYVLG